MLQLRSREVLKDYSKSQEQEDLFYYKFFLQSFVYDDIKECKIKDYRRTIYGNLFKSGKS